MLSSGFDPAVKAGHSPSFVLTMDPRDIQNYQNNMNLPGHTQQQMMNPQDHYNQMLLQQQYMNQFSFYNQNQVIGVDPFHQQQYNNMMLQQQIPMFQQPQHIHPQQVLSQQSVPQQSTLTHEHQRFLQETNQLQQNQHQTQLQTQHQTQIQNQLHTQLQSQLQTQLQNQLLQNQRSAQHQAQHQTQRPAQHRAQHSGVTVQHQAQHQVSQALSHSQLQGQLQATHSTGVQNQHASSLHSGVQSHQALQTQMTAQHALHQSPHVALSNQLNQLSALTQGNTPVHQLQHLQQQTQPRLQAAQATQQLQQQLSLHEQQRLLEEQARQIEIKRQEENTRKQKEQADRLEREEMMKKQREQREQREKEHQEKLRQQIEADRLAEERKVKEDREVKEREKLKRIRDEHMKKQKEDEKLQQECTSRVSNIQQPLALVGTHFINNFVRIIPFPSEHLESSGLTAVCSTEDLPILDHSNPNIVKMISHALSAVNIRDIKTRLDQHGELAETNDLPLDQMPRLIKDVMEYNCNALDVEPEHNMCIAETEHLLLTAIKDDMNRPITSTLGGTMSANPSPHVPNKEPPKVAIQLDQEAIKLRRQMASVGKQPKAQAQRKKRDMVESLFDSLTDYFDPTQGRRRRNRTKTFEEEQSEQGDGEGEDKEKDIDLKEELQSEDDENKFYDKKKKRKKEEPEERPPTPTEVIHERELEWNERQRKRLEKRKRRKCEENVQDYWNNDVMAENDSFNRFTALVDQILDQVEDMDVLMTCGKSDDEEEDDEVSQELLIERSVLDDLRNQTQKLKSWKKLNRVPVDRLVKLETMLERNMKDVISQDGSRLLVPVLLDENTEEEDLTFKELVHDRLARAADAACTALMVMTSYKMPKQVFIEDTIERAINLCKQYLNHIIFPASDSVFRSNNSSKKVKADDPRRKRKAGVSNRSHSIQKIYDRIADLVGCFAELVRVQPLPETSIHHLASMAIASFFVSNVGELQRQAMILASNIFSKNNESVRIGILHDILNSLHRLPPGKNTNNSYRLGPEQWISNTTVLIMQLIQSSVKMPRRKKHEEEDKKGEVNPDSIVKDSIRDAQKLAGSFLSGFLSKCANKGSKTDGEEDYRRLFEAFLQDLLAALHKPAWPASELILSILGTLLVKYYRAKSTDIVIRQACLDYLGSITARLRKDTKSAEEDSAKRFEIVLKAIIYDDEEEPQFENVSDVDISEYSSLERLKKLEQALIDYLIEKNGEDITVEYAINFYAAEWYKETVEDLEVAKQNFKSDKSTELTDKEKRKLEKKMDKMQEKTQVMKDFLIRLVEKKHVRRRTEHIKKTGNIMMDLDAAWTVKYLASKREFTHSFQQYLKIIIYGIQVENTVSLRTKAMKCLTQIIEADYEVLGMNDVRQAVNSRMIDPNAAVREATIELLGKFLLVKEEFIPSYYNILLERIKDSGTAVRKRVIRIMREICEKYPNYNQIPDMLSKLVRRISDEDGVKKLVQETFMALWFQPCSDKFVDQLCKKVLQMTSVAQLCANDSTTDFFEQLLHNVLKTADKSMLEASKQIVDALVDSIIALEKKIAVDVVKSTSDLDDDTILNVQKENQERMLASLTTLSMFSKVRPELLVRHAETLQPYLSMSARSQSEQSVLNEVICMLERVVPLMSHPSDSFLQSLDESLSNLLMNSGMVIVVSVVACAAAVYNNFPRKQTSMTHKFLYFLRNMNSVHANYKTNDKYVPQPSHMVMLQRSLFSLGLLCRYFDFDAMLENDAEAAKSLVMANLPPNQSVSENIEVTDSPERRRYRDNVFALLTFFSKSANQAIRLKAISSIGHLCARHAEYLGRDEIKHMYRLVLSTSEARYLQLKIQALKNLEMFLLAEEKKLMKGNEEWDKAKEQQNLKEMELAGSGLGSAVIQIYWLNVLNCYFHVDSVVRQSAVQVTWLTLSQGLVTPGSSIASLIAMTTDPIIPIRNKVENLLKEIDIKYAGMVQSKAIAGIRISYKLHLMINSDKFSIVRGIRVCDSSSLSSTARTNLDHFGLPRFSNDGQAILSGLYQSLRGNRSHRRSFLNSVLRLFSDDCREKLPLSEWIFVADNIAMFPYQVMDEPLYAIRHIDGIIALSGQAILNQFKDRLISSPYGGLDDDDSLFEPDHIYRRFPENKSELFDLMVNSQACFILLYLKNFLMKLYGFTEAKVQEYSPSEPAKVYEKAVTRRNVPMFQPHSALEEMRPEVIEERNTTQGHYKLAHKICNFRKMLLAIDRNDEDAVDGKEEGITGGVTEREDDEDDVDHGASEIDEQSIADGKDMEE